MHPGKVTWFPNIHYHISPFLKKLRWLHTKANITYHFRFYRSSLCPILFILFHFKFMFHYCLFYIWIIIVFYHELTIDFDLGKLSSAGDVVSKRKCRYCTWHLLNDLFYDSFYHLTCFAFIIEAIRWIP
jgi:hypothetical protein